MLRTRATLLALPWLLVGASALQQDEPAPAGVAAGDAAALADDFQRLEEAWSEARAEWLEVFPEGPAESELGAGPAGAEAPDAVFARAFEQLAARGSGPAALWRLVHFRDALALGPDEAVPAEARASLLEVYARLADEHADDVALLVPEFFEHLALERDLSDYEVDEICARLEMAGRHPEVQARSILVRGERTAPLGCENPLAQVAAGKLFDRVLTEFPATAAFVDAVDARWRLDHLAVGQTPPAFETGDLVGNEIFLADLRARIVIVSFLGGEADDSRAGLERAAELQTRYWDERFSWIGVHEHPDPDAVQLLLQDPDVLGIHAYEGAQSRPAVQAWRIHRRPLTFLLDGQGRVRGVDLEGEALHGRIRHLLDELADEHLPGGLATASDPPKSGPPPPDAPVPPGDGSDSKNFQPFDPSVTTHSDSK